MGKGGRWFVSVLVVWMGWGGAWGERGLDYRHPRPAGYAEPGAAAEPQKIDFLDVERRAGVLIDLVASFPKESQPEFEVERVAVNGVAVSEYLVSNAGIINKNRRVHGLEDFSVSVYAGWNPGQEYRLEVEGKTATGEAVLLAAKASAPAERKPLKGLSFGGPNPEFPYHHVRLTLAKEAIGPGTVTRVEVDGAKNRDARYFNVGVQDPAAGSDTSPEGETYEGNVDGSRDFEVVAPCSWTNGSSHSVKVTLKTEGGQEKTYQARESAPSSGGYWDAAWPHSVSATLHETQGLIRQSEPVHLCLGLFADDIKNPAAEIRVVTYDPTHPKAGKDGYVVAPCQVTDSVEWRDKKLLTAEEKDAETGELVHRYDATTTVELVFLADVQPYEQRVYQVLYGNRKAEPRTFETDLKVTPGKGMAQTVENRHFSIGLAENSGAVETVTIRGNGEPVLLEHKLETNGAVHWNPDCYTPPIPWVHVSDWENPAYQQISGPIIYRTRKYALLPHMETVDANVSYEFYAGQPYMVMSSFMEARRDIFVQAMRNSEIVFNHAVLNEFVWKDPLGKVQHLDIETSRKHPIHALEIPPDTPWMAFINREKKVAFAAILLAYENGNRFGDPVSATQPYIYVQNGPWIYWSRGLVYPFGGLNFTRMMRARAGSFYFEKCAWVPCRLKDGNDPFEDIERLQKELIHPLLVHEWMGTDARTPEKWVMPLLTMPFDEGVAGAVSAHKPKEGE
ncbi:MAG: hypothetical protein HY706_19925 [Candidatus Hydrogenedentes bacterium]|nr:hypothetical protein [Candidatus Hydrogenedentota bacterium]